jgi:putative membrane protein
LKSLSVADAEFVKEQLLQVHAGSSSEPAAAPAVYEASFKDIALAGALQNRALIVTVAILGLFGQGIDDVFRGAYQTLEQSKVTEGVERNPLSFVLIATGAVIVFMLIGWLLSIAYAVTVYHGFRVVRTERGLQVSHGLLNTVHTVIPLRRIQSVQTSASWLYRLLGLNQLYIQSIGGHQASQGGPQVAAGQTLLAPICRPDVLRKLIELINPALQIDKVNFLASDRYLLVRKIVKLVITNLIIFGGCAAVLAIAKQGLPLKLVAFTGGAFTLLGFALSILSYRRQGYAQTPEAFMVCNGTLGQNVTMIPVGNVQAVTLESSWFLRRRGLIDLHVSTPVSVAIVPCIPRETGVEIKDDLIQQSFGHKRRGI